MGWRSKTRSSQAPVLTVLQGLLTKAPHTSRGSIERRDGTADDSACRSTILPCFGTPSAKRWLRQWGARSGPARNCCFGADGRCRTWFLEGHACEFAPSAVHAMRCTGFTSVPPARASFCNGNIHHRRLEPSQYTSQRNLPPLPRSRQLPRAAPRRVQRRARWVPRDPNDGFSFARISLGTPGTAIRFFRRVCDVLLRYECASFIVAPIASPVALPFVAPDGLAAGPSDVEHRALDGQGCAGYPDDCLQVRFWTCTFHIMNTVPLRAIFAHPRICSDRPQKSTSERPAAALSVRPTRPVEERDVADLGQADGGPARCCGS